MTPATDDSATDAALEAAFEALLAGRSTPPAAGGLVAFTDGVRATAARAPRPSAALADLLATGLLTDQSSVPAPRAAAPSRRRRSPMFLSSLLGKLASLGLLAKTGAVAGVVVVGVSTAGFTQTLPGSLQTTWDHVVAHDETPDGSEQTGTTGTTTTGTTDPSGTGTTGTTGTTTTDTGSTGTTGTTTTTTTGTTGTTGGTTVQPAPTGNGLGSQVAGKVDHGYVDVNGKPERVSDLAHQRNEARKAGSASGTGSTTSGDDQGSDDNGTDDNGSDDGTATSGGTGDGGSTSGTAVEDSGSHGSKGSGHRNG